MRKIFSIVAIFLIFSATYLSIKNETKTGQSFSFPNVKINESIIKVELADTIQKKIQGLSGKIKLNNDEGMLFKFNDRQVRTFWMKQMNFPIDIIWIDDDKIVNISKNLTPEGEFPEKKYSSGQMVNTVLEVNAGLVDEQGIKIGDTIKFNLPKN